MIGDEILKQRLGKNLSILDLSKLTGVNSEVIRRLEAHETKFVSKETFDKLSTIIDLSDCQEYIQSDTGLKLGKLLKDARLSKGYRQADVAFKAGYSGYTKISQLENGQYSKLTEETFLKLAKILSLDRKTFEPFIQKNRSTKEKIIIHNKELIQKLVMEKRNSLALSKRELGKKAKVSTNLITNIELHPDKAISTSKLLKVMYILKFTKEEIMACFSNLEEEDLYLYQKSIAEDGYQKKKV